MKLSLFELEVLRHICDAGTTTAPEVHAEISKKRTTAYSTVKTVFDRLEKKAAIYRQSQVGRTSIYAASVSEESVQASMVSTFVSKVFPEDRLPLFNMLIRDSKLTADEINYLEKLLKEKGR